MQYCNMLYLIIIHCLVDKDDVYLRPLMFC